MINESESVITKKVVSENVSAVASSSLNTTITASANPAPNPVATGTPIKVINPGTKTGSIKLPSIADIKSGKFELKKEEVKQEEYHPRNEFTYGDFKHYWDEAITQILAKNQASINGMIAKLEPELSENTDVIVTFNNKVQSDLFIAEQPFILGYLKNKLQNHDIKFIIKINSNEQDNTPYTNAEKFKAMSAKNPNLQVLKDVLGLDAS